MLLDWVIGKWSLMCTSSRITTVHVIIVNLSVFSHMSLSCVKKFQLRGIEYNGTNKMEEKFNQYLMCDLNFYIKCFFDLFYSTKLINFFCFQNKLTIKRYWKINFLQTQWGGQIKIIFFKLLLNFGNKFVFLLLILF